MFGMNESKEHYDSIYNDPNFEPETHHKAGLGQEMLVGGAAFAGFKAFEDHQRKEGKPVSHAMAKELIAGFAAAEIDKLAASKGEDWFDKEEAKRQAKKNAAHMYDDHYVRGHEAEQYDPDQYGAPEIMYS